MPREVRLYLEDMLEAAQRIAKYVGGFSRESLAGDSLRLDAVLRNLEVLGEAAKQVPESVRALAPDLEWRRIAGMRDILAHAYFRVDVAIVWDAAANKVPGLIPRIEKLLAHSSL
ncbi:MAG: DUF86 domain-containing protein [Planctomycetes bacterium]|nr:DUF86 domain-containing protein [Planctomycetota bacterium]